MSDSVLAFLGAQATRDFAMKVGASALVEPSAGQPAHFTIVIRDQETLAQLGRSPDLTALAQAYVHGLWDVEGDIEEAARRLDALLPHPPPPPPLEVVRAGLDDGSRPQIRRAPSAHDEEPLPFWRLWLDESLVDTCAYYQHPDEDLAVAQRRKLDYVCRKLRLHAGERLLDIGCGWGGLLAHAVHQYRARPLGLTLSPAQAEQAIHGLAGAPGLDGRPAVEVRDFRDLDASLRVDKIAAVGVIEHVGEKGMPEFFARAFRALSPGGLMLVQGINCSPGSDHRAGNEFIRQLVFPGASLATIGTLVRQAEMAGFEIRDLESLREHYLITLRAWRHRLEASAPKIRALVGDTRYRTFRAYLAGFALEFEKAGLNVHQLLLARPDRGRAPTPLTREDLYQSMPSTR
jgi:cyclopropane-fatty-acyl-phospholipid synthase